MNKSSIISLVLLFSSVYGSDSPLNVDDIQQLLNSRNVAVQRMGRFLSKKSNEASSSFLGYLTSWLPGTSPFSGEDRQKYQKILDYIYQQKWQDWTYDNLMQAVKDGQTDVVEFYLQSFEGGDAAVLGLAQQSMDYHNFETVEELFPNLNPQTRKSLLKEAILKGDAASTEKILPFVKVDQQELFQWGMQNWKTDVAVQLIPFLDSSLKGKLFETAIERCDIDVLEKILPDISFEQMKAVLPVLKTWDNKSFFKVSKVILKILNDAIAMGEQSKNLLEENSCEGISFEQAYKEGRIDNIWKLCADSSQQEFLQLIEQNWNSWMITKMLSPSELSPVVMLSGEKLVELALNFNDMAVLEKLIPYLNLNEQQVILSKAKKKDKLWCIRLCNLLYDWNKDKDNLFKEDILETAKGKGVPLVFKEKDFDFQSLDPKSREALLKTFVQEGNVELLKKLSLDTSFSSEDLILWLSQKWSSWNILRFIPFLDSFGKENLIKKALQHGDMLVLEALIPTVRPSLIPWIFSEAKNRKERREKNQIYKIINNFVYEQVLDLRIDVYKLISDKGLFEVFFKEGSKESKRNIKSESEVKKSNFNEQKLSFSLQDIVKDALLCKAALCEKEDIVKLLVPNPLFVWNTNRGNNAIIQYCIEKGIDNIAKILICQNGISNDRKMQLLCDNFENMNQEVCNTLVETLDLKDMDSMPPLYYAASTGNIPVVQLLLSKNFNPDRSNEKGDAALHTASEHGSAEIVRLLLNKKAKIDLKNNMGFTPLHFAACKGRNEIVRTLLKQGANPHIQDQRGYTPLHLAAYKGNVECVRLLLQKGSCSNSPSGIPSPLHLAAQEGYLEIVRLLLKQKAEVNAKGPKDVTPLHLAIINGRGDVVKQLLQSGADVEMKTCTGKTSLDFAQNHPEILKLLHQSLTSKPF